MTSATELASSPAGLNLSVEQDDIDMTSVLSAVEKQTQRPPDQRPQFYTILIRLCGAIDLQNQNDLDQTIQLSQMLHSVNLSFQNRSLLNKVIPHHLIMLIKAKFSFHSLFLRAPKILWTHPVLLGLMLI
jgi:hypothetical protein